MSNLDLEDREHDSSAAGQAKRWQAELDAAKSWLTKSWARGDDAVNVYLDEREGAAQTDRRLGLFHSDVRIKRAMLYAKLPKARAKRKYADANDDDARIAAEMADRVLNCDVENGTDSFADALWNNLEDWLIPGLGVHRWHYQVEFEDVAEVAAQVDPMTGAELAPAVPAHQRKKREWVDAQYVYWKHFRYSPCRVWGDARWVAFGSEMSRPELIKRFGKVGKVVPLNVKAEGITAEDAEKDPTSRALVWEIWSKEDRRVYWIVEGYPVTLDEKPDPLGLRGFFPCSAPVIANTSTKAHRSRPDYYMVQDLYRNCDRLYAKITLVTDAIAVRGLYDKNAKEIAHLLQHTNRNQLLPVENWGAIMEKGVERLIWLMPIDQLAATVQVLTAILNEEIQRLQQATGIADIMRGTATTSATATEQSIKAKFGSVRSTDAQKTFAKFASDSLRIKGEIISKHFDVETIVAMSNMAHSHDAQRVMAAAQVFKDDYDGYRIEVVPEDLSLEDMAALRAEKTEWMASLSPLLREMVAAGQTMPEIVPSMWELIKWAMAGLKGASTAEGILDQAADRAKQKLETQMAQPPQPNPDQVKAQSQMQIAQVKGQADMAKIQAQTQGDLVRIAAEAQAELQKQAAQTRFNVEEVAATESIKAEYAPQGEPDA